MALPRLLPRRIYQIDLLRAMLKIGYVIQTRYICGEQALIAVKKPLINIFIGCIAI